MKRRAEAEPDAGAPALKRPRRTDAAAAKAAALAADRHAFAAARGGEFLGVGGAPAAAAKVRARCRWRCAAGHVWDTYWDNSKSTGAWCALCARADRAPVHDYSAGGLRALAAANGGECLEPDAPGGGTTPRLWRCGLAHEWSAAARSIAGGASWCPHCAGRAPLSLDTMRALAAARGGECLSAAYVRRGAPLRWRCALGHTWAACADNVKNKNTWCPHCAGRVPLGLAAMRELAAARGGECLSAAYVHAKAPLQWRCALGHTWAACADNVKNGGTWCPRCAR